MCICYANAQTQQGIVKTRGRMVNGQLVAGQKLSGATVTLNFGNALVSGNNGAFSFNVPAGKSYSLVMAKKQGYTLADPEYTRRSFKYSAGNPFYVVLEDEAQRQTDINAATRKVRRTLTAQLQKREDEIEELKTQNKLTEAEYQKRLKELYDNQSKSELLVKEMAERYAATDYDQLDEFNRQVQMYIEEGELQKADSMIRSKGDMDKRIADYHQAITTNKKERETLQQRQQALELSESGAQKAYDDLAQDLKRKSDIFLQEFKQDSALYCLKMRADLDTTNVDAVWDYASLCSVQKKFVDCEKYYHTCLRAYFKGNDIPNIAAIQNNLGNLYSVLHDYTTSEKYYKLALENREQLFHETPETYRADLAATQNNLGILYDDLHDYTTSEKYYKLALENYEQLFSQNHDAYRADLAMTYWNMMLLYGEMETLEQYDLCLNDALKLYKELYLSQPSVYVDDVIELQNRKIWRLVTNGDVDDAMVLAQETYAMDESNEQSKEYLAECYNSKAYEYAKTSDYVNAHKSIDKAISMLPDNANFYDSKGEILLMQNKNDEALEMWKKVLELNPNFLDDYPEGTNLSNGLKELGLIEEK